MNWTTLAAWALHPKSPIDLALAPVAAAIDINLQRLRDPQPSEIDYEIALELNLDTGEARGPTARRWVQESATRFVDLHDWWTQITEDGDRLRLDGGSVTLDLGAERSAPELHRARARRLRVVAAVRAPGLAAEPDPARVPAGGRTPSPAVTAW